MEEKERAPERETVIIENDRRQSYGWLVALLVILALVVLFFLFGGAELFNGATDTNTINVDTPDSVNVTPAP